MAMTSRFQDELSAVGDGGALAADDNDIQDELSAIAMHDKRKSSKSTAVAKSDNEIQDELSTIEKHDQKKSATSTAMALATSDNDIQDELSPLAMCAQEEDSEVDGGGNE